MRTRPAPIPPFSVEGLVPKLIAGRLRRARPPMATLLCVYRPEHLALVRVKVDQALASRWHVRLWALHETDPSVADHTCGSGPGARFALLNRLATDLPADHWLVVADDDTRIAYPWTLATFLTVCARMGFDLAQPAHHPDSSHGHEFNVQQHGLARETTFVETGPLLAVSPRLRPWIVPFPEGTRMGWYADIEWTDLAAMGYRLGIVDGVPLEHLAHGGSAYDQAEEFKWMERAQRERRVNLPRGSRPSGSTAGSPYTMRGQCKDLADQGVSGRAEVLWLPSPGPRRSPTRGARRGRPYARLMCRSIQRLHNVDPPSTSAEVRAAALQFVRKISGSTKPSQANTNAFERAVDDIAAVAERMLAELVSPVPPQDREREVARRRAARV